MQTSQTQNKATNVLYIGSGYVGSLSAIVMAVQNPGVKFTVYDINKKLIEKWNQDDDPPFYEPLMQEYCQKAKMQGNLKFICSNFNKAFELAEVVFICVNTPAAETQENGKMG